jgi:hypothetical protein
VTILPEPEPPRNLIDILDALDDVDQGEWVSVGDILQEIGTRSFAPLILVPALILVSPLSGIFGLPTIGATLIFLITIQKLAGARHVWLPGFLKRRRVKADGLHKAIGWLRRPCAWVDRHTHRRLTILVSRPANFAVLFTILAITMIIPALEFLPMVTSFFAGAIAYFAVGLLARDGLFTILGYAQIVANCFVIWWLLARMTEG